MLKFIKKILKDSILTWYELIKIMIPVIIVVKIVVSLDLIKYIAQALKPIMSLVGLPGSMGIVWATCIINNIYAGLVILPSLTETQSLTVAQITILATMILIAHSFPVELKIVQKSGPKLFFQFLCRFLGALVLGIILNQIYTKFNLLNYKGEFLLNLSHEPADLSNWLIYQIKNLIYIYFIILFLILTIKILEKTKIISLLNKLLEPIIKILDLGTKAIPLTIIGLTMGISYGGALLIQESKKGIIPKEDIFKSLTLMGLSHSIIEDTLLMLLIGAHVSGILVARFLFSFLVVAILAKSLKYLSFNFKQKYLYI